MRKVAFWGLSLLLIGAFAMPALAQDIKWKGTDDYNGFMAAYNATDPAQKAAACEKFLDTFKEADPIAKQQIYMMLIKSYYGAKNFQKALDTADKQAAIAPNITADDKLIVLQIGMLSAEQVKNDPKLTEYAEKVLGADPKNATALVTMSNLLARSVPMDDTKKDAHFTKTLDIARRALAVTPPQGVQPAQWNQVKVQLHDTACMVLLNQKKNAEAIAACQEALKLDKKTDGYAYYLMGLAMKPAVKDAIDKYTEAVAKQNLPENRSADQLVREELAANAQGQLTAATTKKDDLAKVFARSVATGWANAAAARKDLMQVFTGTPAEMDKLIEDMKIEINQ